MTTRTALATRLAKLETPAKRADGARPGLLQLPRRLPIDEWEKQAVASQQQLSRATLEGVTTP